MTQKDTREGSDLRFSRCWAEISKKNLKHNYDYLRSLAPDSLFLGLCKANAYGHDLQYIGKYLEHLGADMLAVATSSEGKALREAEISLPILVLSDCSHMPLMNEYQLTYTIFSLEQGLLVANSAQKNNKVVPVHLKIDTGMHRLGFQENPVEDLLHLCQHPFLNVQGIYTHFASSDAPLCDKAGAYTQEQHEQFEDIVGSLMARLKEKGLPLPLIHCANSGATLYHSYTHHQMIRPGIALYGYDPSGVQNPNLKPVLSLYSRILELRHLPRGATVGYSQSHTLERDTLVAVLGIGYGDGFPRGLSNQGSVRIHGSPCPILGRICMDLTMVDVTHLTGQVAVGDPVVIYGGEFGKEEEWTANLLEETARQVGTISYELLCNLSPRVLRVPV